MCASFATPIRKILRQAGRRVTPQRMLILETIRESGDHLNANEIHRLAKQKASCLSLSTVYRTIDVLKEMGVIEELHLGGAPPLRDQGKRTSSHHLPGLRQSR